MNGHKPGKTAADFMVIALSPALIMLLVGSLCFFLLDVFYHGRLSQAMRWVMFWYVLAVVLVSRIGIEQSPEYAALYGLALAGAVWIYLVRTYPGYLLGILLLAVVWFCAHKLVWDCTLIDEEDDSSGAGLLQRASPAKPPAGQRKRNSSGRPGLWVVWFSLAALPLFGFGEALLPPVTAERERGFYFLVIYMAAALGLLLTTSFLGLRRYLRQRFLRMPAAVALGWLQFGAGVAILILIGAMFLPRPGSGQVWTLARKEIDYRLRQASDYAMRINPHGTGEGATGEESGPSGKKPAPGGEQTPSRRAPGNSQNGKSPVRGPSGPTAPMPAAASFHWLRLLLALAALSIVGWWLYRCRHLLVELARAAWRAIVEFLRRWLDFLPTRKPVRLAAPEEVRRRRSLADYRNPFFATGEHAWPPSEIIVYTFDAVQAWAGEQGIETRGGQTPREFCQEMSSRVPELAGAFQQLAQLYGHAAYGERLPAQSNLEPLKEIWRRVTLN